MASRAFSRINRSSSRLLLAAASVSLPLLTGCDNPTQSADRQVDAQIASAQTKPDAAGAQNALDAAVRVTGASTAEKLRAKALQATSQLQAAQELSRTVSRRSAVIDSIASEISGLAGQIAANNARVAALKLYDPAKLQDAIKTQTTAITGSDDKPDWVKSDAGTLDSLAANDKQAAALQQQISQLQDTIKTETDQRTKLLTDADKQSEQSEREKGQKSVDLFVQGSDNRKKAADLSVKLDQDNVQLARAQADLSLHQGQQASLQGSLKQLGDRSANVDERWKAVQAEIDSINTDSKKIAGDESSTPPFDIAHNDIDSKTADGKYTEGVVSGDTIASKAVALAALVKKNTEQRSAASTKFDSAIDFYKEAYALANTFKTEVSSRLNTADAQKPEHEIWESEKDWLDPTTYKYLQADAELQRAELIARKAGEEKTRFELSTKLKKPLEDAQLTVPGALADDAALESTYKETQKTALDLFGAPDSANSNGGAAGAIGDLANLEQGAAPREIKTAASMDLIFAYYAASLLEEAADDTQKATDLLNQARTKADAEQANNAYLPSMPDALAPAPAPATPGGAAPR
jgi:hypothetical protein